MILALLLSLILPFTTSISISQVNIASYSIPASSNYWNITVNPPVNFPIIILGKLLSYAYLKFNESSGSFESDSDYYSMIYSTNAAATLVLPPLDSSSQIFVSIASFSNISSNVFILESQKSSNPYCISDCSGHGVCSEFSCNCFSGFAGDLCNVNTKSILTTNLLETTGALQWNVYILELSSNTLETVKIQVLNSANMYAYILYGNDSNTIPSPFNFRQEYFGNQALQLAVNGESYDNYWILSIFCFNEEGCQYYISYNDPSSMSTGNQMLVLALVSALSLVACIGIPILAFYCYRRRRNNQPINATSRLSIEDMNQLFPEIIYDGNCKENVCSICLDNFSGPDKIRKLKCSHLFHSKCIDEWVAIHASCPMCKSNLSN